MSPHQPVPPMLPLLAAVACTLAGGVASAQILHGDMDAAAPLPYLLHSMSHEALRAPARWPVVVGGLGGSGTRTWALLLHSVGCTYKVHFKPEDHTSALNGALDLRFVSPTIRDAFAGLALEHGSFMFPSEDIPDDIVSLIDDAISSKTRMGFSTQAQMARNLTNGCWGWKAPSSALFLPALKRLYPDGFTYLHVVRDPRDIMLTGMPYGMFTRYSHLLKLAAPEERRFLPHCNVSVPKQTTYHHSKALLDTCPDRSVDWTHEAEPEMVARQGGVHLVCMKLMVRLWRQLNEEIVAFAETELADPKFKFIIGQTDRLTIGSSFTANATAVDFGVSHDLKWRAAVALGQEWQFEDRVAMGKVSNETHRIGHIPGDVTLLAHYGKWRNCHPKLVHEIEAEAGGSLTRFGYSRSTVPGQYPRMVLQSRNRVV